MAAVTPSGTKEMTVDELWGKAQSLGLAAWARTSRRMRVFGGFLIFL